MATAEVVTLNDPHKPHPNALEAFNEIHLIIKSEILKSRHHWNKHEPKMWSRAHGIADHELTNFIIENDLVLIRSASISYGTVIIGKIRLPAVNDAEGRGYVHVRIHDPHNRDTHEILFHSLFTEVVRSNPEDPPIDWCAIHTEDKPLEFFNE